MSRSARFVRDVGWGLGAQAAAAAVSLAAVPAIVRGLGPEEYGLYVLLHAAASYLQVLTMGSGMALVKSAAAHRAAGEGRAAREALRLSAALHIGGAAAGAAALWLAAPWAVTEFFQVPERLHAPGVAVIRAAAAGAVFAAGVSWGQAALQGLGAFGAQNLLSLAQSVLLPGGILLLLAFGRGVKAASWWYILLGAASLAASIWAVAARARRLPPGGPPLDRRGFVLYGLGLWLGPLAWIAANQLDKAFIARHLALTSLTLYAVPAAALQRLQVIPAVASSVLVPHLSALPRDDRETLRRAYLRVTRALLLLILPLLALLFAFMPQLLSLWLGGRFGDDSVWPARLLVAAQAAALLLYVPNAAALAGGRPLYLTTVAWAQAALSLAGWAVLIPRWGLLGAALATLLANIVPVAVYLAAVHSRLLALPWGRFLREAAGPPAAAAALLLAASLGVHHLGSSWPRLAALGGGGALLYYAWAWRALSRADRELLRAAWRRQP